jgi:hypothetical protein
MTSLRLHYLQTRGCILSHVTRLFTHHTCVDGIMSLRDRFLSLSVIWHVILFHLISCRVTQAFKFASQPNEIRIYPVGTTHTVPSALGASLKHDHFDEDGRSDQRRRDLFKAVYAPFIGTSALFTSGEFAEAMTTIASDTVADVEMKTFIDPEGLFALKIPKSFFAIRRTNKGDLPDASTGSGRRGSSIFNAGDLAKAEVLAIER